MYNGDDSNHLNSLDSLENISEDTQESSFLHIGDVVYVASANAVDLNNVDGKHPCNCVNY